MRSTAEEMFKDIKEAYEVLSDSKTSPGLELTIPAKRRQLYDQYGVSPIQTESDSKRRYRILRSQL